MQARITSMLLLTAAFGFIVTPEPAVGQPATVVVQPGPAAGVVTPVPPGAVVVQPGQTIVLQPGQSVALFVQPISPASIGPRGPAVRPADSSDRYDPTDPHPGPEHPRSFEDETKTPSER